MNDKISKILSSASKYVNKRTLFVLKWDDNTRKKKKKFNKKINSSSCVFNR